jgi:hypothetical protein
VPRSILCKWVAIRRHLSTVDHCGHFMGFAGPRLLFLKKIARALGYLGESRLRFRDRFVHAAWWSSHGVVGVVRPFVVSEAYMADSKAWDFSRFRQWHQSSPPRGPRKIKRPPIPKLPDYDMSHPPLQLAALVLLERHWHECMKSSTFGLCRPTNGTLGLPWKALVRARRPPGYWPIAAEPYSAR